MTRLLTLALVVGMAGCGDMPEPTNTYIEPKYPDLIADYKPAPTMRIVEFYDSRNRHCVFAYDAGLICDALSTGRPTGISLMNDGDQPTGLTPEDPLPDLKEITNE